MGPVCWVTVAWSCLLGEPEGKGRVGLLSSWCLLPWWGGSGPVACGQWQQAQSPQVEGQPGPSSTSMKLLLPNSHPHMDLFIFIAALCGRWRA
jgi:hypothetical protein